MASARASGSAPSGTHLFHGRKILAVVLVVLIVIAAIFGYLYVEVNSILNAAAARSHSFVPKPAASAYIVSQDALFYNRTSQYFPYVLVGYGSRNATELYINASMYRYQPPERIFVLNISNECYECGNTIAIESSMYLWLENYHIISSPSEVDTVSLSQLGSLPNDSLLVVLNGLLPSEFYSNYIGNTTVMDRLLNRHTSILYVGQNFSRELLPGGFVTPVSTNASYLDTVPFSGSKKHKGAYYFNSTTFAFLAPNETNTTYAGYLTYINALNGSIAAFPNVPASWRSSSETGRDVARAIQQLFWLPRYANGERTVKIALNSSGSVGIAMNSIYSAYNATLPMGMDANGSIRVMVSANALYYQTPSNSTYAYAYAKPSLHLNGTMGLPDIVTTNQTIPMNFTVFLNPNKPVNLVPHLSVYTLNMTRVFTTSFGSGIPNVSGNFTFLSNQKLNIPPGAYYIVKLYGFNNEEYSAGLIGIAPLEIKLLASNNTIGRFRFFVTSQGAPLSGVPYSMQLNGAYLSNGTINSGIINYSLPAGTPTVRGNLNFTLTVEGGEFYYSSSYNPLPFTINQQYIYIAVVVIAMLAMIVLVRAPNRDDFYIDVPSLPEEKKTKIKLKASEVVSAFDKLNSTYRWKYMPLSKAEIRSAIANNIRYNNVPVSLTYSNIERMLDQLIVRKYLISADELYAPAIWGTASGHDIEYLATFKKLRIFLVTHAYVFTEMDGSDSCDIVATGRREREYIVIYSRTSKFLDVPVYEGSRTYIAFLNSYMLEEFRTNLYNSSSPEAEELKLYMAADYVRLLDADSPTLLT